MPSYFTQQDQITYELPGTPKEQRAIKYFFVTPDTGVLHLQQTLMNDTSRTKQYTVGVLTWSSGRVTLNPIDHANIVISDQGFPGHGNMESRGILKVCWNSFHWHWHYYCYHSVLVKRIILFFFLTTFYTFFIFCTGVNTFYTFFAKEISVKWRLFKLRFRNSVRLRNCVLLVSLQEWCVFCWVEFLLSSVAASDQVTAHWNIQNWGLNSHNSSQYCLRHSWSLCIKFLDNLDTFIGKIFG